LRQARTEIFSQAGLDSGMADLPVGQTAHSW
jgi:hypothetical protein